MSIATALLIAFTLTPNAVRFDGPLENAALTAGSREQILETERGIVARLNANKPGAANEFRGVGWTNLMDYAGTSGEQHKDVFGVRSSGEQSPLLRAVVRNAIFGDLKRLLSNNERTCDDCGITHHNLTCADYDKNDFYLINQIPNPGLINLGMFAPNIALFPGVAGGSVSRPFFDIPTPASQAYGIRERVRSAIVELGFAITDAQDSNYPKSVEDFAKRAGGYGVDVAKMASDSYSRFAENNKTLDDGWEYAVASAAFAHNRSYWSFGFHPTLELVGATRHYTVEPEYEVEFIDEGTNRYARFTFSNWKTTASETPITNVVSRNSKITARRSCDLGEGRVGVEMSGRLHAPARSDVGYGLNRVTLITEERGTVVVDGAYCVNRYMSIESAEATYSWPSATSFGLLSLNVASMPCGHAAHPSDYAFAMIKEEIGSPAQEFTRYWERYDCTSVESAASGIIDDLTFNWFGDYGEYRVVRPYVYEKPDTLDVHYSPDYVIDVFRGETYMGTVENVSALSDYGSYHATLMYDERAATKTIEVPLGESWENAESSAEYEGRYFIMIYGCNDLTY